MVHTVDIPDPALEADFELASERGEQQTGALRAVGADYDPRTHSIVLSFENRCTFTFPVEFAQGLSTADQTELSNIEITPSGLGLHWPGLDVDLYVPSLVNGIFGSSNWMKTIGQRGGRASSERKAASARANGKKGGRPAKLGNSG
jgi:hypothetical protein